MLSGCGTTNTTPSAPIPQISITESQFDCGPAAPPLPSDEVLVQMSTRDLLELYKEAWLWGFRCSSVNDMNYEYITDAIAERERLEKELESRLNRP